MFIQLLCAYASRYSLSLGDHMLVFICHLTTPSTVALSEMQILGYLYQPPTLGG